jgi:bacterioferritin
MKRLETVNFSKSNQDALIIMLKRALADEYLAVFQYLAPIKLMNGFKIDETTSEFKEHASEEYDHAQWLRDRIIELGGTPLFNPADWTVWTNDGFKEPFSMNTKSLLTQNIESEQGAQKVYLKIAQFAKDIDDQITYDLAIKIYQDEVKHEKDLSEINEQVEDRSFEEFEL